MFNLFKEIYYMGFKNWLWFTFTLKRNEFHPNLDKWRTVDEYIQISIKRELAHRLELIYQRIHNAKK